MLGQSGVQPATFEAPRPVATGSFPLSAVGFHKNLVHARRARSWGVYGRRACYRVMYLERIPRWPPMPDRLAAKRLTAFDLTFFEKLFRTLNVGNQKSINLNADVFVESFYPSLPSLVPKLGDVIPITLTIFGPDGAPPHVISRAITKREAYKNWPLDVEFIRDPDGEPSGPSTCGSRRACLTAQQSICHW